jgi:hypothetical protein
MYLATKALRSVLSYAILVVLLVGAAVAQNSITVSSPTKDGTDIVTIRYKKSGDAQTYDLVVNVDLTKGTKAEAKATAIKDAINAAGDPNVSADIDATKKNKVKVTGAAGVTIKSSNCSGASGEARDAMADPDETCLFTTTLTGALQYTDGNGDASVFRIGTERGEVEVFLEEAGSIEAAMASALARLQDLGIDAWMPDESTIAFHVDVEIDREAYFGCTDAGVVQVSELRSLVD